MNQDTLQYHRPLRDYIEYFEKLSARSVPLLDKVAERDVFFKDPFNEVRGLEKMQAVFEHMFQTLENPKFKVTDIAWGKQGNTAYLKWDFVYSLKGKKHHFEGMSEVTFAPTGKVTSHIDHWDSGLVYQKIPLLGALIRAVKSKLAA